MKLTSAAALSFVLAALTAPTAATAHHPSGEGHGTGRIPGKADFERIGAETHRYDPKTGTYVVRRPGEAPTRLHYHREPAEAVELIQQDTLVSDVSAVNLELPTLQDAPICVTSGQRVVAVRAWSTANPTTPNAHDHIRSIVRRMNYKFMQQSQLSSGGSRTLQMKVDCSPAGEIKVHDVQIPMNYEGNGVSTSDGYVDPSDVGYYVRDVALGRPEECCGGVDDGSRAVKYLIIHDEGDVTNHRGLASGGDDRLKSSADNGSTNSSRVTSGWAVATIGEPTAVAMHELVHTFGAVNSTAPFAVPGNHCSEEVDLMCDWAYASGPARCPSSAGYGTPSGFPVDCGYDTYFDAVSEAGEWLHQYWNVGGPENPYLHDAPTAARWFLKDANGVGPHDKSFTFGANGDVPVAGDWNNDGIDTPGMVRGNVWHLRNWSTSGGTELSFTYGSSGMAPIAGDWDNDGTDTPGMYSAGNWYLRNSNSTGTANLTFQYSSGAPGTVPLMGDWNNDGTDTPAVRISNHWYLRNSNSTGVANLSLDYGNSTTHLALAGDWDGDGVTTPGVYDTSTQTFYLRNSNTTGAADVSFTWGSAGDRPIVGDWNGDGIDTVGLVRNGI
ncbi:MAG TPA: hypothetical protein VHF90_10780 [Thermoleophilaceae bacterium]|nr:hypothetical protein [Thermoleophilaceae bacterium]